MKVIVEQKRKDILYAVSSLLVIALTIFIDNLVFSEVETNIREQIEHKQALAVASKVPQGAGIVSFVDVNMPNPPTINQNKPLQTPALATAPMTSERQNTNEKHAGESTNEAKNVDKKQQELHLQQLTALDGNDLAFIFPRSPSDRKALTILEFMHKCVGIDIGTFDGKHMSIITRRNATHSQLMRIASGLRTNVEEGLMLSYGKGQQLVRLYPKWFDTKLSTFLSHELGAQNLFQLKGQYHLSGDKLSLENIILNERKVDGSWLLHSGC